MEMLKSFIIMIFGYMLMMAVSIATMIYGWGLEPKSWLIVLVASPVAYFISALVTAIGKVD